MKDSYTCIYIHTHISDWGTYKGVIGLLGIFMCSNHLYCQSSAQSCCDVNKYGFLLILDPVEHSLSVHVLHNFLQNQ